MFFNNLTTYLTRYSVLSQLLSGINTDYRDGEISCSMYCMFLKIFMLLIYQTNFMKEMTKLESNLNTEFRKVVL